MNILGKKVILRAVEEKDLEKLKNMMNEPELERLVGGSSFPISSIMQRKWFEKIQNDNNNLNLIIDTKDEKMLGMATIINIDWKNRRAYHGIKIGQSENRNKGLGTDTVMAIMKYAFEELQLERLDTCIIDYNIPSQKLYLERCGWKKEGVQRNYIYNCGEYHDLWIVGILKSEYLNLVKENNYWDL